MSGRPGSNRPPEAWKATALPNELLPLILFQTKNFPTLVLIKIDKVGKDGFEPPNSEEDRFTVCCRWPLGYLPALSHLPESNWRPTDYKSVALPTELFRLDNAQQRTTLFYWGGKGKGI